LSKYIQNGWFLKEREKRYFGDILFGNEKHFRDDGEETKRDVNTIDTDSSQGFPRCFIELFLIEKHHYLPQALTESIHTCIRKYSSHIDISLDGFLDTMRNKRRLTWDVGGTFFRDFPRYAVDCEVVHEIAFYIFEPLRYLPENQKLNREFVLKVLNVGACSIQYVPQILRRDKEIVLTALRRFVDTLDHVPEEIQSDEDIISEAYVRSSYSWGFLQSYSETLLSSREFFYCCVHKVNWRCIDYASDSLLDDAEFLLAVFALSEHDTDNHKVMQYATRRLQNDKGFVLQAVDIVPKCLGFAAPELHIDGEILCVAYQRSGCVWDFLPTDQPIPKELLQKVEQLVIMDE